MCLRVYLTRGAVFTNVALLIASVFVMFSGSLMAIDIHTQWAYGFSINVKAMFIVVAAAITLISTCCGLYGAVRHNKFCLLLFWCVQLVCQVSQAALARSIQVQIAPDYGDAFVRECLAGTNKVQWNDFGAEIPDRTTAGETTVACAAFWKHDRQVKLENMWYMMYRRGVTDEKYIQMMEGWQESNNCCGFGPPQRCYHAPYIADTRLLPPQSCGKNPGWYVPTIYCEQIVIKGIIEYMGGCRYQYPVGQECPAEHPYNKGCALVAQKWVYERVAGKASFVLNLVAANVLATIAACCLCLKRHDDDVLPPAYLASKAGVWFSKDKGPDAEKADPYLTSIVMG